MLRSIKLVRTLNIAGSRLRIPIFRASKISLDSILLEQSQVLAGLAISHNRNYVTHTALKKEEDLGDVDSRLQEIDNRIKAMGRISKKDIDKVLQSVSEKGFLTPMQALLLIRCCGSFLSGESLKTRKATSDVVWETIKAVGVSLDVSHYNALLLNMLENEIDFEPLDFLLDMKKIKVEPNRVTFQRLIDQYCNKGDIAGATKILEHMKEQNLPLNENIFASLIKGHSKAGDLESAINILSIMKQAGVEPSSIAYNAILCSYARVGDIEKIRNTLAECNKLDILITDHDYLDVIYTLSISKFSEHIDEMMGHLRKGATFNRDAILVIHKMIDKNHVADAFKIFQNLKTSLRLASVEKIDTGRFFIRKLVTSEDAETLIEYCTKFKKEGLNDNAFEIALEACYHNNLHQLAVPLLRAAKENGCEIREHYFYPLYVHYRKNNNLEGLLKTLKLMTIEFDITPRIDTIIEYIIPYMMEEPEKRASALLQYNIPFSLAANAMLINLLSDNKISQASKFMLGTNISYRVRIVERYLIKAFLHTKSVNSLIDILHCQYINHQRQYDFNQDQSEEELNLATNFQDQFLVQLFKEIPLYNIELMEEILEKLQERGLPITENAAREIKSILIDNITPKMSDFIEALAGDSLPLKRIERVIKYTGTNPATIKKLQDNIKELESSGESPISLKVELLMQYCRKGNEKEVEKLLNELQAQNVEISSLCMANIFSHFVRMNNYDAATTWYNKLKAMYPNFNLKKSGILNYAITLINNDKIEDAMKLLEEEQIDDPESNRGILCEKLLNLFIKKHDSENIEKFFNILLKRNYINKVTTSILSPFIKCHLVRGDTTAALEKFKWACKTFQCTPQKNILLMKFIEQEDAKSLQFMTDLCTEVHGEINALFDLALAFLDSDRPTQARRILETPGVRLRRERVLTIAEKFVEDEQVEKLENYIKLLNGLFYHMEPLYMLLLECYENMGRWDQALSVWTKMQEENIQPSTEFLNRLEQILIDHDQHVPFASSIDSNVGQEFRTFLTEGKFAEAEDLLTRIPENIEIRFRLNLCRKYIELDKLNEATTQAVSLLKKKNSGLSINLIKTLLEKLVEKEEIECIEKLMFISPEMKKSVQYYKYLNQAYLKAGKWDDFIEKIGNELSIHSLNINKMVNCETVIHILETCPDKVDKFKSFALKAFEHKIFGPLHSLWLHYYINNDPEGENIWKNYLADTHTFRSINAIATVIKKAQWEKIPEIAERVLQSGGNMDEKRKAVRFMLKEIINSDYEKKYELSYNLLSQLIHEIPLSYLHQDMVKKLKAGLEGTGLSLDQLTTGKVNAQVTN